MAALALKNSCARRIYCDELKSERPDAIVLWVSREAAATLLPALHQAVPSAITYLSEQGCTSFSAILADLVQCLRRFINHRARAEFRQALPRADWPRPDRSGKGNLRCSAPSGRGGSHRGTKSGQGARLPRFRHNLFGPKRRRFL